MSDQGCASCAAMAAENARLHAENAYLQQWVGRLMSALTWIRAFIVAEFEKATMSRREALLLIEQRTEMTLEEGA